MRDRITEAFLFVGIIAFLFCGVELLLKGEEAVAFMFCIIGFGFIIVGTGIALTTPSSGPRLTYARRSPRERQVLRRMKEQRGSKKGPPRDSGGGAWPLFMPGWGPSSHPSHDHGDHADAPDIGDANSD